MNQIAVEFFVLIAVTLAVYDFILAAICLRKGGIAALYLGITSVLVAAVDLAYLSSVICRDYFTVSLSSSIYFLSIDWVLVFCLLFLMEYTKRKSTATLQTEIKAVFLYAGFETVCFLINPFHEFVVRYSDFGTEYARYGYVPGLLFDMHLTFSYLMIIVVLIMLIHRAGHTPAQYRTRYLFMIFGLSLIVLTNAVFLYVPGKGIFSRIDISILGYSAMLFLLYWSAFYYTEHEMLKGLSMTIFDNIDQGIVLFDYEGSLVMSNERAENLLQMTELGREISLEQFQEVCGLRATQENHPEHYSIQCYQLRQELSHPLRCDYRRLTDKNGHTTGNLYVFTDAAQEIDLLTGFQNWESFCRIAEDGPTSFREKLGAVVFDLNNLKVINSGFGKEEGNRRIKTLAETIKKNFPEDSYFVRGQDANLIVICSGIPERQLREYAAGVGETLGDSFQYAACIAENEDTPILTAIEQALRAMQTKKLMDRQSSHSQMLTSLVQALQECDGDTEEHVRRTRTVGEALGRRLGLSDVQLSDLSLLCLLHDIGKIGIPLDILNKPGKLSDNEWTVIKSHAEKGYQIALSSKELSGIAKMILHHHERWDGKGYPEGLSRESIPLLSRVIAVVDAYDAMVNDRAYRKGMPPEKAQEELRRCAGTQFDPFIVSEFIRLLQEKPELAAGHSTAGNGREASFHTRGQLDSTAAAIGKAAHVVTYSRYILDEADNIVETDDMFREMTGYSMEEIRERQMKQIDLIPEEDRIDYMAQVNDLLRNSPIVYLEHQLQKKDGSRMFVFCYSERYHDSALKQNRTKIVISDSTVTYSLQQGLEREQKKARKQLEQWEKTFRTDSLTGLLGHAAYQNDVELRLLKGQTRMLFLMMDIDRFKEYNDTYGHSAGDEFLILVAATIRSGLRSSDLACRMGGDEFSAAIFFGSDTSTEVMLERARQLYERISEVLRTAKGNTTLSMGVAVAGEGADTFRQLYVKADHALYRAKNAGRARMEVAVETD